MRRHAEGLLWAISILSLIAAAQVNWRPYLLAIAMVWIASTVTVIQLHFYGAWRRWSEVPNRRQYAACVGFETLATIVLVGLFVYSISFSLTRCQKFCHLL